MTRRRSPLRRQLVPPPARATWADAYRFGLGLLMIPLGITILVRAFSAGIVTVPAVILGLAFVAFGIYRVYVGVVRYRMYKRDTPGVKRKPDA